MKTRWVRIVIGRTHPLDRHAGAPTPFPGLCLTQFPEFEITPIVLRQLLTLLLFCIGLMYPVLDINKVIAYAQKLYRFMEAAHRSGLMQQGMPGADAIDDEDTNILKMVMATAMTVEASGRSELGRRMFEYVHSAIDNLLLGNVGIKGIQLLVLTVCVSSNQVA